MIDLQRFIVQQLKLVHPRIHLEFVPESQNVEYPYVVYNFYDSDEMVDRREDVLLEVDVWDKPVNGSALTLETLSDAIHQKLNRLFYTDNTSGWSCRFFLANRLMIPDPDPTIRRRQLRYEIRTYRRDT
jgi:hypothetical protein